MRRILHTMAGVLMLGLLLSGSCSDDDSTSSTPDSETPISGPLVMPTGWGGDWEFTITFRGCETQMIHSVERYSATLAVGDTLGLMILPVMGSCPGYIKGDSLIFSAHHEVSTNGCAITVDLKFGALRNGDAITGTGQWTSALSGSCGGLDYLGGCEEIDLVGVRN